MKHIDGLKGRQLYTVMKDKEWAWWKSFLEKSSGSQAEILRSLILNLMKNAALREQQRKMKSGK